MAKHLIDDAEALALHNLLRQNKPFDKLESAKKLPFIGNFPFRFKMLEAMGATTANKANAAIYFIGTTTDAKIEESFVVDDSSQYKAALSGAKGICLASSEYHILEMHTAKEYMALASTSYDSTTTSIVVDNLKPMDGIGTTLTTLTAINSFSWPIINNGNCYLKYSQYSSAFELLQTQCT